MGNELFTEVTDLTGLPKSLISEELVSILGRVGATPHAVTLEDLRKAMATYLTEVIGPNLTAEEQEALAQEPVPTS
jgi:hypothetical protein